MLPLLDTCGDLEYYNLYLCSKFVRVLFLQCTEDGVPMPSGNMYLGTLYIYTEFWNNHKICRGFCWVTKTICTQNEANAFSLWELDSRYQGIELGLNGAQPQWSRLFGDLGGNQVPGPVRYQFMIPKYLGIPLLFQRKNALASFWVQRVLVPQPRPSHVMIKHNFLLWGILELKSNPRRRVYVEVPKPSRVSLRLRQNPRLAPRVLTSTF
jgi:hypothetical protein